MLRFVGCVYFYSKQPSLKTGPWRRPQPRHRSCRCRLGRRARLPRAGEPQPPQGPQFGKKLSVVGGNRASKGTAFGRIWGSRKTPQHQSGGEGGVLLISRSQAGDERQGAKRGGSGDTRLLPVTPRGWSRGVLCVSPPQGHPLPQQRGQRDCIPWGCPPRSCCGTGRNKPAVPPRPRHCRG